MNMQRQHGKCGRSDFTLSSVPLSILFVPARARIARVRLLIDALATFLHKLPGVHDQP